MKKLTVVIPVYNVEAYLNVCLDSIINQFYKNLEIICINDGSTDHSLNILKEYAGRDNRIIVIDQPNQGVSVARNAGIRAASGEYVTFVDCDDYMDLEAYQVSMPLFALGVDAVCFGTKIHSEEGATKWHSDDEYYSIHHENVTKTSHDVLMVENISCGNKLFKLDIIKNNNILFPEGRIYEDAEFCWKYMVNTSNIYFIKNRYYNYIRRKNSIMSNTFSGTEKAIDHLYVVFNLFDYFKSDKRYEVYLFTSWPFLFRQYFNLADQYTVKQEKDRILNEAKNFVLENNIVDMYKSDVFISNISQGRVSLTGKVSDLSFWQKIYSIKKTKYRKDIHILGFKLSFKSKIVTN
ncbi:MAG: Glycosyl transferase family 2 protein [Candidatus Tokpelaia hoelldobleri]|uniref:Glycosyl transferase family 2 protein n=1 Tax=Candidatus Tokpelaia hoelldobleri TaxID=1902579 RepID=A0A1U9JX17_9HYPH|nr:MAG: Glycosyl transferase family 2 protein [Candidatus Tokpelaia hoelldoblerii]